MVWGKQAENLTPDLKEGSKVLAEGCMTPDPKIGNPRLNAPRWDAELIVYSHGADGQRPQPPRRR